MNEITIKINKGENKQQVKDGILHLNVSDEARENIEKVINMHEEAFKNKLVREG